MSTRSIERVATFDIAKVNGPTPIASCPAASPGPPAAAFITQQTAAAPESLIDEFTVTAAEARRPECGRATSRAAGSTFDIDRATPAR